VQRVVSIEEVERRLSVIHGDTLMIDKDTYVCVSKKAVFVDAKFGRHEMLVMNVLVGHCHPLRAKEHAQQTCLKRHGAPTPLGSKVVRKKIEQTWVANYGVKHPWSAKVVQDKNKLTMKSLYGAENPQQCEEIKNRTQQTCLGRYGVTNPLKLKEFHDKGLTASWTPEACQKREKTCVERLGVKNPAQNEQVYKKGLSTKRNVVSMIHWKTDERLQCHGSYERAVVTWLCDNKIDFDWQVQFSIPNDDNVCSSVRGKKYTIDLFIKDGRFANTYVEIKGRWMQEISKQKWEWFHETHPNSLLWMNIDLRELSIIRKGVKNG